MPTHRKSLKTLAFAVLWLASLTAAAQSPVKPKHAAKAMVASNHRLASQAGVEMMRAGGNAVDAAVATGFALAVVYAEAGNIGGGGFMLLRFADGKTHFLDYREKAPAAATERMFLDADGKPIPQASTHGYKAAGVPGSVAGLTHAQKKWGKLPLARVMQPAIQLAKEGFTLTYEDEQGFKAERLSRFAVSKRIFQRNGDHYRAGEVFRQPELARTLERIAAEPESFYKGTLGKEIAADIQRHGGIITANDLAGYEVKERAPVRGSYRGYEIISAPPPSSGGIALISALNVLEGWNLAQLGNRSADTIHVVAETFRRVMYDRAELLGDPDFARVPVAQLIDKKYAAAWRETIDPHKASESRALQRPADALERLDVVARNHAVADEPEHTTHYSVIDAEGNAVATTTTINDLFGSGAAVEAGFLLNDEMDDFTIAPNTPNTWGSITGTANVIAPGKRPLSAMTPTLVVKDGKPFLIVGARGGPRIITTVANIIMGVIDFGMTIQEAVSAPRFHHQWLPDSIRMERVGFSPDTVKLLGERGHKLDFTDYWSGSECLAVDPKTGERLGASDPRYYGEAVGF